MPGAIAVMDGGDAMGQVLTARAMEAAIAPGPGPRGRRRGPAQLRHFGTAMYFTLMAARAGCVGFLSTNASPSMAPWGGREKVVGNNPWSWAAPAGRHAPMVLDIANTGVARGKIYLARQKGLPIPEGWALDAEGRATTDPEAALDGLVLPMAGHKGYAIALVMDMLSGILTGSASGTGVAGPYQAERRSGAGQFVLALDIAKFQPPETFAARMEAMIAELKGVAAGAGRGRDLLSRRDRGPERRPEPARRPPASARHAGGPGSAGARDRRDRSLRLRPLDRGRRRAHRRATSQEVTG